MICTLRRLQQVNDPQSLSDEMSAFGISGGLPTGFKRIFMSHPHVEERIETLENT